MKNIVIVGGGFGGVQSALELDKQNLSDVRIVLISNQSHFEYHARFYDIVAGANPLEGCIPLQEIFSDKKVEVVIDLISNIDIQNKMLTGESSSKYNYDFLVLALGSETAYPDIPGLKEFSFDIKSIEKTIRLNKHIHQLFESCKKESTTKKECSLHFVIVGAGPTGVELAGALAVYIKKLAILHKDQAVKINIDLVERGTRILPSMSTDISRLVAKRLTKLGVNILTNQEIVKETIDEVYLKHLELKTKTVIWSAGAKINHLYNDIPGLTLLGRGKVLVDEYLLAKNKNNVFVIGDGADTKYSGMAQTAINEGKLTALNIANSILNQNKITYQPKRPIYAIPVGKGWAMVIWGRIKIAGRLGWILRQIADLKYFLSILPIAKALRVFRTGKILSKDCPICNKI